MRRNSNALSGTLAFALMVLPCAWGYAGDGRPIAIAQAVNAEEGEDDSPTPPEKAPESKDDEAPPEEEYVPADAPNRLGQSRRMDPFDAAEEPKAPGAPHPAIAAHPGHDVVVCEAGCDGPSGTIVYMQKKE